MARDQTLDIAQVAAAAQGVLVVADKAVAGVAGVAVFASEYMAVHAQAQANAGAPGDIGAVGQWHAPLLQGAPAALGLQGGNAVVFDPHLDKVLPQRRLQPGAGPVIGQAARWPGQAAANIGCGQLDLALVHHKGPARGHAQCLYVVQAQSGNAAALAQQAHDLRGQRPLVAGAHRGLAEPAAQTCCVSHADRNLGATNVDTGHRGGAGWQPKVICGCGARAQHVLLACSGRSGRSALARPWSSCSRKISSSPR